MQKKTIILAPLCAAMLAGCSVDFDTIAKLDPRITAKVDQSEPNDGLNSITIGDTIVGVSGSSITSLTNSFKDIGSTMYEDISSDNDSLTIALTDDQLDIWLASYESTISNLITSFNKLNSSYKMVLSDDYGTLDIYCDAEYAKVGLSNYIAQMRTNVAMYQVLSEIADDDVALQTNIYNSSTGNLVQSLAIMDTFKYSDSDWGVNTDETPTPSADSSDSSDSNNTSDSSTGNSESSGNDALDQLFATPAPMETEETN